MRKQAAGAAAALMIGLGYPGERLSVQSQLATRGFYRGPAMIPILYIVHGLLVGPFTPPARRLIPDIGKDPQGTEGHCHFVTYLPCGLSVPHARFQGCRGRGCHSVRLLCLRHHLRVWCRPPHLQHHGGQWLGSCPRSLSMSFG